MHIQREYSWRICMSSLSLSVPRPLILTLMFTVICCICWTLPICYTEKRLLISNQKYFYLLTDISRIVDQCALKINSTQKPKCDLRNRTTVNTLSLYEIPEYCSRLLTRHIYVKLAQNNTQMAATNLFLCDYWTVSVWMVSRKLFNANIRENVKQPDRCKSQQLQQYKALSDITTPLMLLVAIVTPGGGWRNLTASTTTKFMPNKL